MSNPSLKLVFCHWQRVDPCSPAPLLFAPYSRHFFLLQSPMIQRAAFSVYLLSPHSILISDIVCSPVERMQQCLASAHTALSRPYFSIWSAHRARGPWTYPHSSTLTSFSLE